MPWLLMDTNFSFLQLIPEAQSIPAKNRDFFVRTPDKGWTDRLHMLKMLPSILNKVEKKKDARNYDSHIKLVEKYWGL